MITSYVENITPEMAEFYLQDNKGNRRIRESRVDEYANDMRNGKWVLNGEPIVFSEDGVLVNGQHRLSAIVKAGVPVSMLVVRGIAGSQCSIFDRGASRSTADTLKMANLDRTLCSNSVVAIAKAHFAVNCKNPTDFSVKDFLELYTDRVLFADSVTTSYNHGVSLQMAGYKYAIVCALEAGISEDVIKNFHRIAVSGMCESKYDTAAVCFRNWKISGNYKPNGRDYMRNAFRVSALAIEDFYKRNPRKRMWTADAKPTFVKPITIDETQQNFLKENTK